MIADLVLFTNSSPWFGMLVYDGATGAAELTSVPDQAEKHALLVGHRSLAESEGILLAGLLLLWCWCLSKALAGQQSREQSSKNGKTTFHLTIFLPYTDESTGLRDTVQEAVWHGHNAADIETRSVSA